MTRLTIEIRVERPTRVWHLRLAARLRALGHAVRIVETPRSGTLLAVSALLALEKVVYGSRSAFFATTEAEAIPAGDDFDRANLTIRLDGQGAMGALIPRFDGVPGERAMIRALLARRDPVIEIDREDQGVGAVRLAAGRPAIEDRSIFGRALDHGLARLIGLLVQAVARWPETHVPSSPAAPRDRSLPIAVAAAAFFVSTFAGKVSRRLERVGSDHWAVAWREAEAADVAATREWGSTPFRTLPDDGSAYYADPFPVEVEGRRYIFCEKYPYATEKGVIAVFEIDAAGMPSEPRVVLEHGTHLSYPQVFERNGTMFMLPETGAAGRIELFRAESFPDRWAPHAVLVDDIVAGDATFIEFGGRCWLFATIAGDGGSSWDQLALFHAPALEGPWSPHGGNPVLVDAATARPAGAMWVADGVLWRVAQDCRDGYGAGLSLCRVDRLDPEGYAQTLVRRLGPPDGLGAQGVHTLNRSARIEAIDWRAPRRR